MSLQEICELLYDAAYVSNWQLTEEIMEFLLEKRYFRDSFDVANYMERKYSSDYTPKRQRAINNIWVVAKLLA